MPGGKTSHMSLQKDLQQALKLIGVCVAVTVTEKSTSGLEQATVKPQSSPSDSNPSATPSLLLESTPPTLQPGTASADKQKTDGLNLVSFTNDKPSMDKQELDIEIFPWNETSPKPNHDVTSNSPEVLEVSHSDFVTVHPENRDSLTMKNVSM